MSDLINDLGLSVSESKPAEVTNTEIASENTTLEVENTTDDAVIDSESTTEQLEITDSNTDETQSETNTVNNNEKAQNVLTEDLVLKYLKDEKGIDVDSLKSIKTNQEDKDIQLYKKYKEISNDGSIEDFLVAKEMAQKDWSKFDKGELVAKYLSEVDDLPDNHISRVLKKLAPETILSEDEFIDGDFNGDYDEYVQAVKDSNIDKEIEFQSIYKKSIKHYDSEAAKYKELFNSEVNSKKDNLDDYFVGLAHSIDGVDSIDVNDTKIVYTKEDKEFMLKQAQQINDLASKYFNENGTAKDGKKLLQDFGWLDEDFRKNKQKQIWQVGFNAGKEAMIKNKANITLDTNNQTQIKSGTINIEDIIKKSFNKY